MLRHYPAETQELTLLLELIKNYAGACRSREPRRVQKVFAESLLSILVC